MIAPATTTINAFGRKIELETGSIDFIREDSLWRFREVYERFLGMHVLPRDGLAIDIGAGFGAFAIPLALLRPEMTVIAFEPQTTLFEVLVANIEKHRLGNVIPVHTAVGPAEASIPQALRDALAEEDAKA